LPRVAIFTDSASDLDPAIAAAEGITVIPLHVSFGPETFKAGVDLSNDAFWERMVAPDAPFPTTAAASPGEFLEARATDMVMYVALETLEYLRKGGRISGAQAAIGTLLSVKPIIAVKHGVVDTAERVRTRTKARERLVELITQAPIERLAILHTVSPDVEAFRDLVAERAGLDPADVTISLVGSSVGPHLGPGCVGAAILYKAGTLHDEAGPGS